jgi:Spy/CpxP family protein refolding chaperone
MRTKSIVLSALTLILAHAWSTPTHAEELKDPFYGMQNPKRALRGAALTDEQMGKILEYRRSTTWEREQQITKEQQALWHKFHVLYTSAEPLNVAEMTEIAKRATQLGAEHEMLKFKVVLEMRALLSPEQLRRVAETNRTIQNLNARIRELTRQMRALPATVATDRGK